MRLGDAISIFCVSPAWAALLGACLLAEPIRFADLAAIAVSIAGVVLIARPSFLFGEQGADADAGADNGASTSHDTHVIGAAVVAAGSVLGACSSVAIRASRSIDGGVHPAIVAHAYALFSMLASPLALLLPGLGPRWSMSASAAMCCVGSGALAVLNQADSRPRPAASLWMLTHSRPRPACVQRGASARARRCWLADAQPRRHLLVRVAGSANAHACDPAFAQPGVASTRFRPACAGGPIWRSCRAELSRRRRADHLRRGRRCAEQGRSVRAALGRRALQAHGLDAAVHAVGAFA